MTKIVNCCFSILFLASCYSDSNNQPVEQKARKARSLIAIPAVSKLAEGMDGPLRTDSSLLHKKIKELYRRAVDGKFSTRYAILADLGLHSGSYRMYLVQLSTGKIIKKALVAHGSGTTYLPAGQRQYSNVEGSLCSSLGVYKIGGAYQGSFGLAYKLHGLDTGNSNAYLRAVVLHSYSGVPDAETEDPICQSWGCPMVSPAFLTTLASYIDVSPRPMLLFIFDSGKK